LLGALLSVGVLALMYGYTLDYVNSRLIVFNLLPLSDVIKDMALYFALLGSLIGAIGSGLSIKRFLNV
jgi:cell division transport system permease protein